ncbi:MAG: rod shape-determining protein MreD [Phycisphaerales bacterium]|nr:rod shape-determining protein MreD [Phycisphaerales bacterium]
MKWSIFAVALVMALILETSMRQLLIFRGMSPSFLACLVVFVALFATRMSALWACWIAGMMMDILSSITWQDHETFVLLGPYALGYTLAGFMVLQIRAMVFRRRALTVGALALACVLLASLFAVGIFVLRSWYTEPALSAYLSQGSALAEIGHRLGIAVYTGLIAIPIGWLLQTSLPVWGFEMVGPRRGWR